MPPRWCTVTVTGSDGKRHSVDVLASSTFDAAHLYLTHAKANPATHLPVPTVDTVFEITIDRKIHTVSGAALKGWIEEHRQVLKGPKGMLFSQRPQLD